jgi:hypothetical protein
MSWLAALNLLVAVAVIATAAATCPNPVLALTSFYYVNGISAGSNTSFTVHDLHFSGNEAIPSILSDSCWWKAMGQAYAVPQ